MIMIVDKIIYVFKGVYFWLVGDQGVFIGVLKIFEFWEKFEDDIDVGYIRNFDGFIFIFKGLR